MSTALAAATTPTGNDFENTRRITEDDPDYQRLHTQTVARLQRSLRQYARELLQGEPGADTRFIHRHIGIIRAAYEAAHKEGQRDYWPAVSLRQVRHRYIVPDQELVQKRLAFYALGSVLKMAHEVKTFQREQQVAALSEAILLDDPTLPASFDNRTVLQGQVVWSGLQDGYAAAGASDVASPYALLWWNLGPAKVHCDDCPSLALGSPYDPPSAGFGSNQLDQTPGDGQTACGAACKCSLSYDYPDAAALAQLGQAIASNWNDWMPEGDISAGAPEPVPVLTPPAKGAAPLTPKQKGALDSFRNASAGWDVIRRQLPPAPGLFSSELPSASVRMAPWNTLSREQQAAITRIADAQSAWLDATAKLVPAPEFQPDPQIAVMKWLQDAAEGKIVNWNDAAIAPYQQTIEQWLEKVASGNVIPWPPPTQPSPEDVAAGIPQPPKPPIVGKPSWIDAEKGPPPLVGRPDWLDDETLQKLIDQYQAQQPKFKEPSDRSGTIFLPNPYPRQKGGRFGYGPGITKGGAGTATKGTGGTKGGTTSTKKTGTATKTTAKVTKAAKTVASAVGSSTKEPSIEEQKAAAELRVKTAQTRANKATRDFNKAEKDAAAKQINNKEEIARLQAVQHEAFINEFHSYSDAKEAIAEERAQAKASKAPKTYEKMMAAKPGYEEAKASYAAAKATSDASRAIHDELQSRYIQQYDFSNMRSYDKMMKDHPDLKAADKQRWADQRVTDKAQTAFYRAQSKYTGPRDKLAGNIDDAAINAYPSRIAAKAALAEANAKLGEANGQTTLRAAFDARESARLELKDAQQGLAHPTWKYALNSAPTTHAQYTNLQAWPQGTLQAAQSAGGRMTNDRHEGDLALAELQQAQGFNGKPDIVTEAELNGYVKGGETEIWRGDTRSDHTDNLMVGDYHAGLGIRGNGTYAQEGANGITTARSYAQAHGKDGLITRMSVKADARVINYDDLRSQAHTAAQHYQQEEQTARTRGDNAGVRRAKTLGWLASSDSSRYAVALGYDAVRIPSHGQWIILNRTAVRISHQVRGGGAT